MTALRHPLRLIRRLGLRRLIAPLAALMLALPAAAEGITVFAAASLKTALDGFAADWQTETGTRVRISYAGSGQLARQIIAGAPADLFLSAASDWMDAVEAAGAIRPGTRRDLLGNRLVLIAADPQAAPVDLAPGLDLAGLIGAGRLAMAQVDAVPAGQYGKAALTSLGLWQQAAPRLAQADNVRAALALVSTGEAPYGIVYATDAAAEPRVRIVGEFPEDSHPPIRYPLALLTDTPEARAFYQALAGPRARAAFEAQGFAVLD